MRKEYQSMAIIASLFLGCFSGFSQEKPKKPVKHLIVFEQSENKSVSTSRQIFNNQLDLPKGNSLEFISQKTDAQGVLHKEYQQYYKDLKVEFSSSVLNAKKGVVVSMVNNVFRIKDLSVTPSIGAAQAFTKALAYVGAEKYLWQKQEEAEFLGYSKPQGTLVVLPSKDASEANLAYRFDIYATNPLYRADVYIDAHTGDFLMENKKIHHTHMLSGMEENSSKTVYRFPAKKAFYSNVSASGNSLYNGSVNFTANSNGGSYTLNQTSYGQGVNTYDMHNGTNYSNATYVTSNSSYFSHATGVQAHFAAEQTYQFYSQVMSRNSFDGNGAAINSFFSYKSNYVNAFWDGQRMTYGDGDGVNYGPLVSLDIVGHELTHAVTQYSAGLVYQKESGALNESFSDIQGESIEKFASGSNDWLMGDEIGAGGSGGALRSISNPNAHGQPDTYGGQYWVNVVGCSPSQYNDNCGVHTNSGVQNYWFYLTSVGGSGTNDNGDAYAVSGIGMTKAAKIAYRNLTVYMSAYSNYNDARNGAIQASIDLYGVGGAEEIAVTNAWHAVGVGNKYDDGGTTPPPSGDCLSGDVYLSLTFDNYPEETGWALKNSTGTVIDSENYSSSNADGSTVNVTFSDLATGDYTFTITDQYGDGFCCAYGNGSYTLSSDAGIIATGGSFGSSESTSFCVEEGGTTPAPSTDYCASQGNNASYEWIDLVTLNNMSHTSGNDGGYADNTNLSANLAYGANTIQMSTGISGSAYTEYWAIWIDYNQDGTFSSNELVVSGSSDSSATLQGTFSVPNTALAGSTRMRVSMKYNSAQTACEIFSYGEVEDYTVNIGQSINGIHSFDGIAIGNDPAVFSARMYPNPVAGNLNIHMGDDRQIYFEIYDLTGRRVANGQFTTQTSLDVNAFSAGIYLLKMNDGQKEIVKRFIKQ